MGLRINTNVLSLSAQRNMGKVRREQSSNLEKLSSGSRINKAADDAAGLAISEKLKAHISGSKQATRNANDGISLLQTAEGGLNEIGNILVRMREISVQSASDTVGDKERSFTNMEFQALKQEVNRISESTTFNSRKLLSGEGGPLDFQIGINNDANNDRLQYDPSRITAKADQIGIDSLSVSDKEGSRNGLAAIDDAIGKISGNRAELGALQNRLQSTVNNLEVKTENLSAANSRIRDTDVASATANLTKSNILMGASTSVLSQANSSGSAAMKLIG